MKNIEYPVRLKDISKFEKQNPTISTIVFGYEEKTVYPLRKSKCTNRDNIVILMLLEEDGVQHYCLVKNPSRLLAFHLLKNNGKHYFCWRCLNPF